MTCEGRECEVPGWHYEMDVRNPRMYGQCRNCRDILCHILPLKHSFVDLEIGEWSYERLNEQALRDQPLRQTLWQASQNPIRLQRTLLEDMEGRIFEKLKREVNEEITEREKAHLYDFSERVRDVRSMQRDAMDDLERVHDELRELGWKLQEIIEGAEQSIRRALRASRLEYPLPDTPQPPFPVLCDGRHIQPTIYGLVDPREPERVRYIGQTLTPGSRFSGHASKGAAPRVMEWVKSLEDGPLMVLIENPHRLELEERERFWIAYYRARGLADLNTSIRVSA